MSNRVFAVVSIYDNADLVPHFLSHYARLGVERILVVVRTPAESDWVQQVRDCARNFPAIVQWFCAAKFADSDKSEVEQGVLANNGVGPDDYVMHLDLDEFHEYPAPLAEIVDLMNRRDDWAIRGWLLDRVAENGQLAPLRSRPSIGEQFPIGCVLTETVLQGWTQKIMLCRGRVRLKGGVNHDTCNAYYDDVPAGRPDQYVVHHFKWTEGLLSRLQVRLERSAISSAYAAECSRFIAFWRDHGQFDLTNPVLRARRLGELLIR